MASAATGYQGRLLAPRWRSSEHSLPPRLGLGWERASTVGCSYEHVKLSG